MLTTYKTLRHIAHALYNHAVPLKYLTLLALSGKQATAFSGSHGKIPTTKEDAALLLPLKSHNRAQLLLSDSAAAVDGGVEQE